MFYISSYDAEERLWGITDTEDGIEELYTATEIQSITTIENVPVLGAVNNTPRTVCHVVGSEYFEFLNRIRGHILKCKLAGVFTTLDDTGNSPRVIDITDSVHKFMREKNIHNKLYLFNKSDTIEVIDEGVYLIDSYGKRQLYNYKGVAFRNDLVVQLSSRYMYNLDIDDILWGYRINTLLGGYASTWLRVTNMEAVYKTFADDALF